jgi:putative acetyltransferase
MKKLPPEYDIRYSLQDDLQALESWFSDPVERRLFPFETDAETKEALKNWIGFAKFKASLTGLIAGQPCALGSLFLMPYRKVAHHCSFFLIVDPEFRRKGVGTSMVRNLIHLAKTRFRLESIQAEVFEPSEMVSVLQKLQFESYARQENFIKIEGKSHARVLMEHFFS